MTRVILALLLTLAACGCGGPEGGPARLQFMMWGEPPEERLMRALIGEFERENPGVTVEILHVPGSYDEKLMILMAARTPPDVMYCNLDEFLIYALSGALLDLGKLAREDLDLKEFYPQLVDAFTAPGGKLMAIPKDWSPLVLYYNASLFAQAGLAPPSSAWTREDFLQAAKALTADVDRDGRPDVYGALMEPATAYICPWIWMAGGDYFDPSQRRWTLGAPSILERSADGLQFFADLSARHRVTPPPPVGTTKLGYGDRFPGGTAAMTVYGHWKMMPFSSIRNFRWGVAELPATRRPDGTLSRVTPLFQVGYGIAARSRHPDEAWRLVKHLVSERSQRTSARAGLAVPSRRKVAESDDFLKMPPVPGLDKTPFVRAIGYGKSLPNHPAWKELESRLSWDLDLVVRGRRSAREAISGLQEPMDAILAQYGDVFAGAAGP